MPEQVKARYSVKIIPEIISREFAEYSDLRRAFYNLDESWPEDTVDPLQWREFAKASLPHGSQTPLLMFHDKLISWKASTDADKVSLTYLGQYNPYIRTLSRQNLEKYPEVFKVVKLHQTEEAPDAMDSMIDMDQWRVFADAYLNPIQDGQHFYFSGDCFSPIFGWDTIYIKGSVPGLKTALRVAGAILLLAGLWIARKLYIRKRGIMVNPPVGGDVV